MAGSVVQWLRDGLGVIKSSSEIEALACTVEDNGGKKEGTFLYYRLPGRATLRIYNNRTTFLDQELKIAQFGSVEVITSTIMGKMADAKITFDTTTGSVLTIE